MSHEYLSQSGKWNCGDQQTNIVIYQTNQSIRILHRLFQMSFSWSTSSIPSFAGMKPATTNSFADALKRLAEHVEEKNKNSKSIDLFQLYFLLLSHLVDTTSNGTASVLVQSSADFANRINPSYVNNSIPSEQALRLYTQFIQEVWSLVSSKTVWGSFLIVDGTKRRYPTILFASLQWIG